MHEWLHRIDQHFPVRYTAWIASAVGLLLFAFTWIAFDVGGGASAATRCCATTRSSGTCASCWNTSAPRSASTSSKATPKRRLSRAQRSLVYQRAKGEPDKRPFGTQLDVGAEGYEWINHSLAPTTLASHDFRVTIGEAGNGCTQPYPPACSTSRP
jgi:hypothetical protein